jgi:hypothetical protein
VRRSSWQTCSGSRIWPASAVSSSNREVERLKDDGGAARSPGRGASAGRRWLRGRASSPLESAEIELLRGPVAAHDPSAGRGAAHGDQGDRPRSGCTSAGPDPATASRFPTSPSPTSRRRSPASRNWAARSSTRATGPSQCADLQAEPNLRTLRPEEREHVAWGEIERRQEHARPPNRRTEAETRLASAARPPSSDGKWFLPSPLLVSPRRATALEPAAGCRSGGRPRFSLVAHPRSARRAGRVSSPVFGCSSWRVASARCNAGRRAAPAVPSRCEDSEALAKHRQERGAELAVPRHPARFPEN